MKPGSDTELEKELRPKLLDEFSQHVLTGAMRVVRDEKNPIRLNLFAAAVRELYSHTLHLLAPDERVTKCSWYRLEPGTKGPTRAQRAKFATQGGLSDEFIAEVGVDVEHLHRAAIDAINELNKFTHVRPGVIEPDKGKVESFVSEALSALIGLFESFAECSEEVLHTLQDAIDRAAVEAFVLETIPEVDELATHHSVEEAYVEDMAITAVTETTVHFKLSGSLSVELQWGSNSDWRRGDGAKMRQSFPFEMTMQSSVDALTNFDEVVFQVDTSRWYQ
ncbi:hypothetical protein BB934_45450 (plasmid) [Microvirga ossetica]|uniref:Uncharacterized protein n=1 Tax=Microvirga ossetica TaxID=1882682 RepID=A0A1B2EZX3_9HYPH|nr:hypothetical protein [Microvirga ossetica]ANY85468.1 hypothetical protein BB934_45450 [Microvirga ossetica]